MALVECVPNFSEGRNREIVQAIVDSISAVDSVKILDMEMDADHNRSVITFVCEPKNAVEAAFQGVKKAASLIDMFKHKGEHPRFGATDVLPFIPVEGAGLKECVDLARSLGERVGRELSIPVFLYSDAASRNDRKNLEEIRSKSFQFEQLSQHISEEKWKPDYGPGEVGKAGATIIGARDFLIAYNVNLPTTDLDTGKKIASAMRAKDGGLANVKALAFSLKDRGLTQISMNLTNFRKTPIYRAFEAVRTESARYGIAPVESEIVGLIPLEGLVQTAGYYLQLRGFSRKQILEEKLWGKDDSTLDVFMEDLASASPAPGGGSASALVSVVAASLASMVSQITLGKEKYSDQWVRMQQISERSRTISSELRNLMKEDVEGFNGVVKAWGLPRKTDEEKKVRKAAIEKASLLAIRVPWRIAVLSRELIDLSVDLARKGIPSAVTDSMAGISLALSAMRSSLYNVLINLKSVTDASVVESEKLKVKLFLEEANATAGKALREKEEEIGLKA